MKNIWSERSLMPACKVLVHFVFEFSCHLPCIVTGELYSLMSYINCKMHVKTWSHHFGWGIYQLLQWCWHWAIPWNCFCYQCNAIWAFLHVPRGKDRHNLTYIILRFQNWTNVKFLLVCLPDTKYHTVSIAVLQNSESLWSLCLLKT